MENNLPQLFMRHPDLSQLPPLAMPYGFSLHSHTEKSESADKSWEHIIEKSFETHCSFEESVRKHFGYKPEYVLYVAENGKDISTSAALEKENFPGEGYIHMVGTLPEAGGRGAGRIAVLASLHSLASRGFKTAVLSTDDFRIPAIKVYYRLGFEPMYTHESHEKRWEDIFPKITK